MWVPGSRRPFGRGTARGLEDRRPAPEGHWTGM